MSASQRSRKQAVSLRIKKENVEFIKDIGSKKRVPFSKIVDEALDNYRKFVLRKELRMGFLSQTEEDVKDAMSEFHEYLLIVDNE